MLELEEAVTRILGLMPAPAKESIPLNEAHGRILLETASAGMDLPLFDNSAMDGYAVQAADVAAAGRNTPVRLAVTARIPAGESFRGRLEKGECARVFTGSPLPPGADAVVMQEDTDAPEGRPEEIAVFDAITAGENVRFRGEDVKRGAPLGEAGDELTVGRITLLAAAGVPQVEAARRPVVGLLATGSELREPGAPLEPGQIYESNRAGLTVLIRQGGGVPKAYPIVPDSPEATRSAIQRAFAECDLVVSCGGASVGEMDFVKRAFVELGGALEFWRVAIKPGRPFVLGSWSGKVLFGLPGNPVSALVTFLLLVRPALRRWQGAKDAGLPRCFGTLGEALPNHGGRRHFVRVKLTSEGRVISSGVQASHILSSLAAANGLVDVPANTVLPAGTLVPVIRWE